MIELLNKLSKKNTVSVAESSDWKIISSFENKNLNLDVNSSLLKRQLIKVEKLLYTNICDSSWMGECSRYHLKSGGKRFRAALALFSLLNTP